FEFDASTTFNYARHFAMIDCFGRTWAVGEYRCYGCVGSIHIYEPVRIFVCEAVSGFSRVRW
ncbi:hypothetical protein, partial [Paraburkholderia antibiotica]|uniref:hypothetical protein n=1 Tax=Paraburkholderia antibiotica TaxID=2728839 RepID=UPI00198127A4